ncbi:MAG: CRISPR-associated ring nuclease Crn1 [Sulfolobaceae archaeon]
MVNLVATLGKTPGGIAETFLNLSRGNYSSQFEVKELRFDNVFVVRTKEVEESYYTLKAVFMCCLGFPNVRDVVLPFDDITSPEDFSKAREVIKKVLRAGDYLDFTGGRKAISTAAVLAAREVGAHIVSTVIPHEEYELANKVFMSIKDRAMRIYSEGDCVEYICRVISKNARTIVFF